MGQFAGSSLPVVAAPPPPAAKRKPGAPKHPWLAPLRLAVQAVTFAGFVVQGVLYYKLRFRPLGSLLPFMAYESLGHEVVSTALLAWGAIFLLTMIFGRLVCGWLCPIGFFQDAGERLLGLIGVKLRPPASQPRFARYALAALVIGHLAVMPLLASPVRIWRFDLHFREPWLLGFPFHAGLFTLDLALVFAVTGLIMPLAFGPRAYCRLVCETGLLLDHAGRYAFGRIRRSDGFDRDVCISCQKCTRTCPQGIDVFEEVHLFDRVVNTECISCMQCVNVCPVDVITYSMRKQVRDTGKVAGYLASARARVQDLPRHLATGAGAAVGGYVGFARLPPSYFHTYLLFASLGGVAGWLAWRACVALVGGPLTEEALEASALSLAEREAREKLAPLSNREKMKLAPARPVRRWIAPAALASVLGIAALVAWIAAAIPPRIVDLAEVAPGRLDPAARAAERVLHFGVAPVLAPDELQIAYGRLGPFLEGRVGGEVRLVTAESYAALARGLERGAVDAAILPPAAYAALERRARGGVAALLQAVSGGRQTYDAMVVAREEGPPRIEDLRGKRVAFTSLDSLSGYLAPTALLRSRGIAPIDLGEAVLAGNHTAALALLVSGRVEACATYDGALAELARRRPDVRLRTLAVIPGLPQDVVVVRAGLRDPVAAALRAALEEIAGSAAAAPIRAGLERSGISGFAPVDEAALAGMERWLEK